MTSLLDLDLDYAPAMGRDRVHHGPIEWHQAAPELCRLYLEAHAADDLDVVDSCDVMVWIGLGDEDDVGRWQSLERHLLDAVREHFASECDSRPRWAPRVVVGNAVAGAQRTQCGWCQIEHSPTPLREPSTCAGCGVSLSAPLRLVDALRMSVAAPANDVGGR